MRWWLSALVAAGCGVDTEPPPCPETLVTYETFGAPFLISWCRGCHSSELTGAMRQRAPSGVNFNTVEDARDHAARIAVRAGPGGTMPPVGGPSPDERMLLVEWIGCGAP
jgi:uncharacterized membrane protein